MSWKVITAALGALMVLAPLASAGDAQTEKGQQVFTAQKCSLCHSVAGKGNAKGSLDHVASKWKAEDLRRWIVEAKIMTSKHGATRKPPMKDYSSLAKEDVDALVAYLQTLQ
jgi:mono/diheme cytochrome c family protein